MIKKDLTEGTVDEAEIKSDSTEKTVTRVMQTLFITRTPGGRVATIQLSTPKSGAVEILIDEPTARAIAKVFD